MTPQPIILNSTTTCSTCKMVERRLTAAGIPFEKLVLDLPENAEHLAELKRRLETDIITVPLLQWGSRLENLTGLSTLITDYKEAIDG